MKWIPFIYDRKAYDLNHLHPCELIITQEAKNNKPEKIYYLDVTFSIHCFSRKKIRNETIENELLYKDSRESRIFCFDRYKLSKNLPKIIEKLQEKKCYHTTHGNYFTIDLTDNDGIKEDYEVYFVVSKSNKKGRLNLYVQSAYIRNKTQKNKRKPKKSIRFDIIVHNTFVKKTIKKPQ